MAPDDAPHTTEAQIVPLSRFRADIARATMRHGKALLEARDMSAQVTALQPLEAYFMFKELGIDDAAPLVMCATTEQLQTCIDLDCWVGDQLHAADLDVWLAPFCAMGPEALAKVFCALDPELQVVHLANTLNIYDLREEEDVPDTDTLSPRQNTLDGFFCIERKTNDDFETDPLYLVNAIYKMDMEEGFRLLTAARWELTSTLEEDAYNVRVSRLEQLGFPQPETALRLFAAPNPATPHAASPSPAVHAPVKSTGKFPSASPQSASHNTSLEPVTALPALYAKCLERHDTLFVRAVSGISDVHALERIEQELVHLINSAVIACGESPRDLTNTLSIAERVRDTLSLGLAALFPDLQHIPPSTPHAAIPPPTAAMLDATAWLQSDSLFELFRHGHAATAELRRDAQHLARDPIFAHFLDQQETEADDYSQRRADRAFVRGLLSRRGTVHAGKDPMRPEKFKAFATHQEIQEARARLQRIAQSIV